MTESSASSTLEKQVKDLFERPDFSEFVFARFLHGILEISRSGRLPESMSPRKLPEDKVRKGRFRKSIGQEKREATAPSGVEAHLHNETATAVLLEIIQRVAKEISPQPQSPSGVTAHVSTELHDPESGRLDAARIAEHLGVSVPQLAPILEKATSYVYKSPSAESLQPGLIPIARILEILSKQCADSQVLKMWLNSPHPDLGNETPLQLILKKEADTVLDLLESALSGQPQ